MTEQYASVEDIRLELPFNPDSFGLSDGEYEMLLEDIRKQEIDRIDNWAHVSFGSEETTETASSGDAFNDQRDLLLDHRPVTDVSSVIVNDDELDEDQYYAAETHVERAGGAWPSEGRRNVVVEYEYGLEEIPGPVQDGLVRLIRSRLEQRKTDGLESESGGDTSYTYRPSDEIRHEVRSDIDDFGPVSYFGPMQVL